MSDQTTSIFIQNVNRLIQEGVVKNYSALVKDIGWNLSVLSEVMNGKKIVPKSRAAQVQKMINQLGSSQPFTQQEENVMQLIITAHKEFLKLEEGHPNEMQEWVKGIHELQNVLISRMARRMYPNYFK